MQDIMSQPDDAHKWRSPLLGARKLVDLAEGTIEYFERGRGPTLVLAHGWVVNANLWRNVVVIASVMERLDLSDVTLVGNDSGGAYSQIAVARHTDRVGRLVLTSCETPYDRWPPPQFDYLRLMARDPASLRVVAEGLRDPEVRGSAYGAAAGIAKRSIPDEVIASYALPGCSDPEILRDAAAVMSSASTAAVRSAGRRLIEGAPMPLLLVWSREDSVFPLAHAERYADALPAGELVVIDDAYSFTPEDQPTLVADSIRRFVGSES